MKHARRLGLALLVILWSALPVHAAPIIGSFLSTEDFFGMTFVLQNDSAAAGVPGTFADVLLELNGGQQSLFNGAEVAAATSLVDTLDTFATPFTDGVLTFVFRPEGLPTQDYRLTFSSVIDPPVFFAYTADAGGVTPIPEPSTLMLIGLGVAGMAARRRRQLRPQPSQTTPD